MDKEEQRDVKCGREAIRWDRSSEGRLFNADEPTTEKALRCIIPKRPEGSKTHLSHQNAASDALLKLTLGSRGRKGKRGGAQ